MSPKPQKMPLENNTIQYTRKMADIGSVYKARAKYLKKMYVYNCVVSDSLVML